MKKKPFLNYKKELCHLTKLEISESDLTSIEDMEDIRNRAIKISASPLRKMTLSFSKLRNSLFLDYINQLSKKNPSPIYVWTDNANMCGLYKAPSLDAIHWDFPFDINQGVLVFLTKDIEDRLLLDLYRDDRNHETVDIEACGKNWSLISQDVLKQSKPGTVSS